MHELSAHNSSREFGTDPSHSPNGETGGKNAAIKIKQYAKTKKKL